MPEPVGLPERKFGFFHQFRRPSQRSTSQFVRYATVGAASNALLYGGYLLVTAIGVGPKAAMSILDALGLLQTFVFNRTWTFSHWGETRRAFLMLRHEFTLSATAAVGPVKVAKTSRKQVRGALPQKM